MADHKGPHVVSGDSSDTRESTNMLMRDRAAMPSLIEPLNRNAGAARPFREARQPMSQQKLQKTGSEQLFGLSALR